ncbi:hypothetical protein [Bordetella petrii]|uniref:hypothetical protein n=1 Tax=Bordetella petrii TaxID=94624 RepID=UPI0012DF8B0D|nr:hypothetical protein [Bordetella petrii]
MKIWTTEEEAAELRNRFVGVNRAAFARQHKIAGGQAMIYQHINGLRPMSMEAAIAYARAFNCELQAISPRLAQEAERVAAMARDREAPPTESTRGVWPFSTPFEVYEALDDEKKKRLDERVADFLAGASPTKRTPQGKQAA